MAARIWRAMVRAMQALGPVVFREQRPCALCGSPVWNGEICDECMGRLPLVQAPLCRCCGTPLRDLGQRDSPSGGRMCAGCREGKHYFSKARAAVVYDGVSCEMVQELKYRARLELAGPMAAVMADVALRERMAVKCDVIVSVPMHPLKEAKRGYNQAAVLANHVGNMLGIPVESDALSRRIQVDTQTHLAREARRINADGSFVCSKPGIVNGKRCMLVDDVLTSGSTADGCARALLRAGAGCVEVLTFAVSVADARDWFVP